MPTGGGTNNIVTNVDNTSGPVQTVTNSSDTVHDGMTIGGNYHDIKGNQNYGLQQIGAWLIL